MSDSSIHIHTTGVVEADAATVWRAIAEPSWGWSGFMLGLGSRVAGQKSTLRLRGLAGGIPITVSLLSVEPEREIRWSGGIPGVFVGEHYIRLVPEGRATRVEHGEVFSGFVGTRAVARVREALTRLYARDIEGLSESLASRGGEEASTSASVMPALPDSKAGLTPEWLESVVSEGHPGAHITQVNVASSSLAGDGLASTADRIVLDVTYAPLADAGLPTRMLLKTILLGQGLRVGPSAIRGLAAALGGIGRLPFGQPVQSSLFHALTRFQERFPQAPDAMYENEVRFYREIRPVLELETPAVYASLRDPRSRRFGVLMEDLNIRRARFPSALDELTGENLRAILSTLAALHARFWASPRLEGDLSWVPRSTAGGMFEVFDGLGLELIRAQLDLYPFKRALIEPVGHSLDSMWDAMWATQRAMETLPQTLLHGDPHIGNTYLLPDGGGGLLDWQLMMRGCFAHDVAYVIASGLPTPTRRLEERALVQHYLDALASHGVTTAPTFDDAFELYRRAISWGLVIGWLITPPQNYGEALTSANIARLVAAAVDLGTFDRPA